MYRKVAIIGVGTLGGFLAKSISNMETVKELVIIDYDSVEKKNLKNHIYRKEDVDSLKVDALYGIIKSSRKNIKITRIKEKYIEGKSKIPKCNLVIDCRDFTYDRGSEIDVRLYISYSSLVIDCKKNVIIDKKHEGKYSSSLTKSNFELITSSFSHIMSSGTLKDLVKNQLVQKISLNMILQDINEAILKVDKKEDIILDSMIPSGKFSNMHEIKPIFQANKDADITLRIGDECSPTIIKKIPKKSLKTVTELISLLNKTVQPYTFINVQNFAIFPLVKKGNEYTVCILPNTGAA